MTIEIKDYKLVEGKLSSMETGDIFEYGKVICIVSHFTCRRVNVYEVDVHCLVLKTKKSGKISRGKIITLSGETTVKLYEDK